jgi:hypothetical protein
VFRWISSIAARTIGGWLKGPPALSDYAKEKNEAWNMLGQYLTTVFAS